MDQSDSPNRNIENDEKPKINVDNEEKSAKKPKKSSEKRVKRKKTTSEDSTEKLRSVRKKSTKNSMKKESNLTENSTKTGLTSSDEEQEEVYRSKANLIPELSPKHENVVTDDVTALKKSTSRKKRRSKLSTKKPGEKSYENSPRFFEEDSELFPDTNLRLALQNLKDDVESLTGEVSPAHSPGSLQPMPASHIPLPQQFPLLETLPPTFPASQPVKQIYLQDGSGFSKANHRKVTKLSMANQILPSSLKHSMTPLDLGLESQKVFRSIGIFCHGFLAGLAFWQLVMVFVLADSDSDVLDFIALYSPLSQPLHLIFYFLTVICTISILDRYDLAQFEWQQLQKMLTFRSGGIAIFIYLLSLLLTLVTTRLDDKISLYHINATLFEQSNPKDLEREISSWKILNLCRSLGVILGWLLVSLRPNTDLLYKHLKKLSEFSNINRDIQKHLE